MLGPIEIFDDEAAVAVGGPKMRAVLAVLVVHANSVVSADRLIDEVWGEQAPRSARRSLHSYIANLRRTLNVHGEILQGRHSGYVLEIDPSRVDAVRFEESVDAARSLHLHDPLAASHLLDETLLMWRGSPFDSLASDVPSLQIESTRLEELRLAALELRIACELEVGRSGSAIGELERLVAQYPFRESFWRQLMLALYRSGRQGEALGAYQRARKVLAEELGIEPSRDMQQLEQQILLQDASLDGQSTEAQAPGVGPALGRLVPEYLDPHRPAFLSEDSVASEAVRHTFVGREHELRRLDAFLNHSLAGTGRLVFVVGEAGTGKTALMTEFVERSQAAHPELIVAGGACEAVTGIGDPYLPFRGIISMLAADCEMAWAAGVISRDHALRLWNMLPLAVQAICDLGPTLLDTFISGRALADRVRAFDGGGEHWLTQVEQMLATRAEHHQPQPEQYRTNAEYVAVIEALAAHRPLVMIIDDLHWADASSIQLLAYLSRRLQGRRILLIGTYRPEDVAQGRGSKPHPLAHVISEAKHRLGDAGVDLDRAEVSERRLFVDDLVDAEPNALSDGFRVQLAERSGGRALFAAELLRHVQLSGDLEKDAAGRWVEKGEISWQALPSRVEGVIEQLFAGVDAELRDALLVASVEGVEFTAELVASVLDIDEAALIRRLSDEAGQRRRLVEARSAHRTESQRLSRYRFRHNLFQQYLYDGLDPVRRAHLHEVVGNGLEKLHRPQPNDVAVQLASHFHKAGVADKASHYLQQAGDSSMRLSATTEAVGYYRDALQIMKSQRDDPDRNRKELTLLVKLSRPLAITQGYWADEVEQALRRARVLAEELAASTELFATLRGLWHYHHSRLELDRAGELADRLLGLAQAEGEPMLVAQAHWMLGENAFTRGNLVKARDHLERAIAAHDPVTYRSDPSPAVLDPGVISRGLAANTQWVLGYPERASKDMAEALDLARQQPRSLTLGVALAMTGTLHEFMGEGERALHIAEEMIGLASDMEYAPLLGAGRFNRGAALAELGVFEDGISLMQEGITTYRGASLPRALAALGAAYWKAGRAAEGLAVVTEALALTDKAGGYFLQAELGRLKGELGLLGSDDERPAMDDYQTAIDMARSQGAKSYELRIAMSMARLRQKQGRDREAFKMLSEIFGWFTEGFETGDLREAKMLLDDLTVIS